MFCSVKNKTYILAYHRSLSQKPITECENMLLFITEGENMLLSVYTVHVGLKGSN